MTIEARTKFLFVPVHKKDLPVDTEIVIKKGGHTLPTNFSGEWTVPDQTVKVINPYTIDYTRADIFLYALSRNPNTHSTYIRREEINQCNFSIKKRFPGLKTEIRYRPEE